ncbi:DNA replication ATP-dependent helicase/nuclease DNA2 [Ciona intestinalis]
MNKKTKSGKLSQGQGNILSFCSTRTAEDLLRSKDGLKQGKIDPFMKSKNSPGFYLKSKRKTESSSSEMSSSPAKRTKVLSNIEEKNIISQDAELAEIASVSSCGSSQYCTAPECTSDIENSPCNNTSENISKHPTRHSPVLHKPFKRKQQKIKDKEKNDNLITEAQQEDTILKPKPIQNKQLCTEKAIFFSNESSNNAPLKESSSNKQLSTRKCSIFAQVTVHLTSLLETKVVDHFFFPKESLTKVNNSTKCSLNMNVHIHYTLYWYTNNPQALTLVLINYRAESNLDSGDIINLIPNQDTEPCTVIDGRTNLLVHHPDTLISGTTVSNSLGCLRRAVLSERFKNTEIATDPNNVSSVMLVGTIVHYIFQTAIKLKPLVTKEILLKVAKEAVYSRKYFADMLAMNTDPKAVLTQVENYLPQIESWIKDFRGGKPCAGNTVNFQLPASAAPNRFKPVRGSTLRYDANVVLTEVKDIEENVWSPRYGLKGKIDLTGNFKITDKKTRTTENSVLPLELKTGKDSHSMEHHVQVSIYTMFCNERRNKRDVPPTPLPAGLLLYLKNLKTSCVPLKPVDSSGLMMLRNKIADSLTKTIMKSNVNSFEEFSTQSFPPTIDNVRTCRNCSQLRNCALVYKTVDESQARYRPSSELFIMMSQLFSHLTDADLAYFRHWMTCTFLEEQAANKKDKQKRFWLKTPQERFDDGKCITGLKLGGSSVPKPELADMFVQAFKRSDNGKENIFKVGDLVLVNGNEPSHIAIATGTIHSINKSFIAIITDRDFSRYDSDMSYSIDNHIWLGAISTQSSLSNLSLLMSNETQCNKLRHLIIMHRDPFFAKNLDFIPRSSKDEIAQMLRGLNKTQRQAIKRVLISKDYTLVVGMPGSGKTTTIVAMIRILLLCGLRVLVTSYTHSAVDNLLLKLIKYKTKFLRLGRPNQVHPNVLPYTEAVLSQNLKSPTELQKLYDEYRVVGCTCLSVTSHVFFAIPGQNRPIFDVCIVDEASQIAQPACLAPLFHSERFVLVGDHLQLPPLVVSLEAKKMGADESLFRRLTSHKLALCELTLQYRMNKDIMALSNHVTYEGRLECAHPTVAEATVKLDKYDSAKTMMPDTDIEWLLRTIDPKTSVIFLDTSKREAYESEVEHGVQNMYEATIVTTIAQWLIKAGCPPSKIGIIAPFRKQLRAIEEKMNSIEENTTLVEINTVDKYQGRDKSVILLSFVRSKKEPLAEKKGELLNDWRRLNVGITRAKHKLVMVGCTRSLMEYEPCKKIIEYVQSNNLLHFL